MGNTLSGLVRCDWDEAAAEVDGTVLEVDEADEGVLVETGAEKGAGGACGVA